MNDVLILGNGMSRQGIKKEIESFTCPIWVCNKAYREVHFLPNVQRVGTVHSEIIEEALYFRNYYKTDYLIISKKKYIKDGADEAFLLENGWSTGNLLLAQALIERYDRIYIAGFDFGGADIYQITDRPGINFKNQYNELMDSVEEERRKSVIELKEGMFYNEN